MENDELRMKFENVIEKLIIKTKEDKISWTEVETDGALNRYECNLSFGEINQNNVAVEEREGKAGLSHAENKYYLILLASGEPIENYKSTAVKTLFNTIRRKQNAVKSVIKEIVEHLDNL